MDKIVVVDTDRGFIRRFQKKLVNEFLNDRVSLFHIEPDTSISDEEVMIRQCIDKIKEYISSSHVIGVFVDVVIYERYETDTVGVKIVEKLRHQFHDLMIFNITSSLMGTEEEWDLFSEATLGLADGVFAKSYLDGKRFSASRFRSIFENAALRRKVLARSPSANQLMVIPEDVFEAFQGSSLAPQLALDIEDIKAPRFWTILKKYFPNAHGELKPVSPGRSGALVIRVIAKEIDRRGVATRPKEWLLKLSEDTQLIAQETQNHLELKRTSLKRTVYPQLLQDSPMQVDGLSGIVYEFEGETLTLLEALGANIQTDGQALGTKIGEILRELHGDLQFELTSIWEKCRIDEKGMLMLQAFVQANDVGLNEQLDRKVVDWASQFILSHGTIPHLASREVAFGAIHADLNCGNILVSRDFSTVSLIDFALRTRGAIVRDYAKLERDILFRVIDSHGVAAHDFHCLRDWQHFKTYVCSHDAVFNPTCNIGCSDRHSTALNLVATLRKAVRMASEKITEDQYLVALFWFTLTAILHPSVPTAKKYFALDFAHEIYCTIANDR